MKNKKILLLLLAAGLPAISAAGGDFGKPINPETHHSRAIDRCFLTQNGLLVGGTEARSYYHISTNTGELTGAICYTISGTYQPVPECFPVTGSVSISGNMAEIQAGGTHLPTGDGAPLLVTRSTILLDITLNLASASS